MTRRMLVIEAERPGIPHSIVENGILTYIRGLDENNRNKIWLVQGDCWLFHCFISYYVIWFHYQSTFRRLILIYYKGLVIL